VSKWFELSTEQANRISVAEELEKEGLPPFKDKDETATAFWARVEQAGLLHKALELYDEFAEGLEAWEVSPSPFAIQSFPNLTWWRSATRRT